MTTWQKLRSWLCSLLNKEVKVAKRGHTLGVLGVCSSEAATVTTLTFCLDLGIVVAACSLSLALLFLTSCLSMTTVKWLSGLGARVENWYGKLKECSQERYKKKNKIEGHHASWFSDAYLSEEGMLIKNVWNHCHLKSNKKQGKNATEIRALIFSASHTASWLAEATLIKLQTCKQEIQSETLIVSSRVK